MLEKGQRFAWQWTKISSVLQDCREPQAMAEDRLRRLVFVELTTYTTLPFLRRRWCLLKAPNNEGGRSSVDSSANSSKFYTLVPTIRTHGAFHLGIRDHTAALVCSLHVVLSSTLQDRLAKHKAEYVYAQTPNFGKKLLAQPQLDLTNERMVVFLISRQFHCRPFSLHAQHQCTSDSSSGQNNRHCYESTLSRI